MLCGVCVGVVHRVYIQVLLGLFLNLTLTLTLMRTTIIQNEKQFTETILLS